MNTRISVDSSVIVAVAYAGTDAALDVEFTSGACYRYAGVPANVSCGRRFGKCDTENVSKVDVRRSIIDWVARWASRWEAAHVKFQVRESSETEDTKAAVTFETPHHVGSAVAWNTGMVELIVMDLTTRREVIMWDREWRDPEQLGRALDECAEALCALG